MGQRESFHTSKYNRSNATTSATSSGALESIHAPVTRSAKPLNYKRIAIVGMMAFEFSVFVARFAK